MVRLQIPYCKVLLGPRDLDPDDINNELSQILETSRQHPIVLEIFNSYLQYLIFIRDGQFYYASHNESGVFKGVTLKEFFANLKQVQFPQLVAYQTDLLLYHTLLVYLQKKPELKVSSTLVDLDELLDKAADEKKNILVTASQPGNLLMIRYQAGKPIVCFHGFRDGAACEGDIREEFLVKVYTLSAHRSFEINLFSDLVVTHADDARSIPDECMGSIASFFLSQPPRLIVKLKSRPLKTYAFTGNEVSIGRLPENDIAIDNLSVSRKHAVIASTKQGFLLSDLCSKNGTFLNGERIDKAILKNGDRISIGKYQIIFQIPYSGDSPEGHLDQTVIIPNYYREELEERLHIQYPAEAENDAARIYRKSNDEEYPLEKDKVVIGKGKDADIRLTGLLTPRVEVEITRQGPDYLLKKVRGHKKVTINGEEFSEKVLDEEDCIAIGSEELVFKR